MTTKIAQRINIELRRLDFDDNMCYNMSSHDLRMRHLRALYVETYSQLDQTVRHIRDGAAR